MLRGKKGIKNILIHFDFNDGTDPARLETYKMPTKNRKTIIMVAFIANADSKALINAHIDAIRIVFFRPL